MLTAADLTTGYRMDVSSNGGPFRSLVKRRSRYTVGTGTAITTLAAPSTDVPGSDEGSVQRAVAVQQKDPDGQHRLRVGEGDRAVEGLVDGCPAARSYGRR